MKRIVSTLTAGLLLTVAGSAFAADFGDAATSAKSDLEKALAELAQTAQEIEQAKVPLSKKLNATEDQVIAKRKELETLRRDNENRLVDLNSLKTQVKARQEQFKFIDGLLAEYTEVFGTQLHVSEDALYRPAIDASKAATGNPDLDMISKQDKQAAVVEAAMKRAQAMIGGQIFDGKALAPSGGLVAGHFALIGPVSIFASTDGKTAGLAEVKLGSPEPSVIVIPDASASDLRAIADGKTGKFPLDTTGGDALKIAATDETLFEHIAKGGVVIWPIVALGLISMVIGAIRYLQIGGIRVIHPGELQQILDKLKEGKEIEAMNQAMAVKGPVGELMEAAISHAEEKKEYIEEVLYEKMLKIRPQLEKWLPFIALTAATAPLLGLLGTVTGMINTFKLISVFGTGDPKMLSSGISEALITTEYGLIVAIPALLIHAVVSRKAKSVLASMEQAAVAFINGVPEVKDSRL